MLQGLITTMKVIFLVLCCLSVCLADYSKQEVKAIMKAGKQCMKELSIPNDDNIIERVMYNRGAKRADMEYMFCAMKKLELMDSEGNFLVEAIVQFLADKYDTDKVRPLITKCTKQKGEVLERTWKYHQCFFEQLDFEL